jgi:hypothetical protein
MQKERDDMDTLEKELEECWKEAANTKPLSDEELDAIIKDVRRSIRKVVEQ